MAHDTELLPEDIADLPAEVREAISGEHTLGGDRLDALGAALSEKRKDAVNARAESGIESVWAAAEEAYLGIDNTNRGTQSTTRWHKPSTTSGPLQAEGAAKAGEVRSTVYVRLTSRYVDAAHAKVGEILLPVGDKAFSFAPTPVPDLIAELQNNTPIVENGIPLERPARPGEVPGQPGVAAPPPGVGGPGALPAPALASPGSPAMVPLTAKDLAAEAIDRANASAKKAEKRVHDWMVQSQFYAEMRKVIFDCARIGTGVLHGPFPKLWTGRRAEKDPDTGETKVVLKTEVRPGYAWADPWNLFPVRGAGENIHHRDGLFYRDFYSARQVRGLIGLPGYVEGQIRKVLEEGPRAIQTVDGGVPLRHENQFEVWHYYGDIAREDLEAVGSLSKEELEELRGLNVVHVMCTMINDRVVRAIVNPLTKSGEYPYHAVPWKRRPGFWAGVGVAEELVVPQRIINAATRAMLDNAGKSSGSIIALDRGAMDPADNNWSITRDKLFFKKSDSPIDDIRKAFAVFEVPNRTPQLLSIIEYALRLAEESTSIPLVTQGQSGPTSPDTFGATQLQNNNANQLLRLIGYTFDDCITEPVVRQSYEWLLLDEDVPDDEKGDWEINARGSSVFIERAIQDQTVQAMGAFVKDPAYGTDPKRWFAEFMRTKRLDPAVFQYTKEEQERIAQQPQPQPPQVEVAKLRSADVEKKLAVEREIAQLQSATMENVAQVAGEVRLQTAEGQQAVDRERIQKDTDRDTAYVQAEAERTRAEQAQNMRELELKREIALLEYANKRELKIEDVRADLAKTAMTLRTQKELAAADRATESPRGGAEPPGKAPAGEAFTK